MNETAAYQARVMKLNQSGVETPATVTSAQPTGKTDFGGGKEIQFLHPGKAHTAGDIVMWLPQEKIVATGDIVTGPVPLMPSPWTDGYGAVLSRVKALGFATLVPGHGPVEHDSRYLDLLAETIQTVSAQMKASVARSLLAVSGSFTR